ncbi:MAG: CHAD domain-containing protein [Planctomycetes bacterium]|nr:CHAD domain-containing protein [Planctomycetota bacterium]
MIASHEEREYKLRAFAPLSVLAVDALLLGKSILPSECQHVDTYLDDEHASLLRGGIGLRCRRTAAVAHLCCKSDAAFAGGLHVRRELAMPWEPLSLPDTAAALPKALCDCVEPFVLHRPLLPIVSLTVVRHSRRIVDGERVLGEVLVDFVTANAHADRRAEFVEVEIEVGEDLLLCAELAGQFAAALPVAVADDNKLSHALTLLGLLPAIEPSVVPRSVGDLLAQRFALHLEGIRAAEASIRSDGSAECVHSLRVHLRRLRTLVRAFCTSWQPHEADWLTDYLSEWNRQLAEVRELDVARAECDHVLAQLPLALRAAEELLLMEQAALRAAALSRVCAHLRSAGHLAARARLESSAWPMQLQPDPQPTPAGEVAAQRLARAAGKLRKGIRALSEHVDLPQLHEVRLLVKRLRYLAEECAAVLPAQRTRVVRRLQAVQLAVGTVCDHDSAARRYLAMLAAGPALPAIIGLLGACAALHYRMCQRQLPAALRALHRLDRRSTWRRFDR